MSIKQNGGVFGRNPTFNDVTIEGDLIINGEVFTGLDFQGSWNASTNSPALASSVGTNGEFYIVSIAGTTDLNGITNWGIGDWAIFNGTAWQRVEGGADGNFNALTANSLLVNGDATVTGGNLIIGTSGKGIDFSATAGTGTSELFNDYEEGTFTPTWTPASGSGQTISSASGWYTKTGNRVFIDIWLATNGHGTASGNLTLGGLPFAQTTNSGQNAALAVGQAANAVLVAGQSGAARINQSATTITPLVWSATAGTTTMTVAQWGVSGTWRFTGSYQTA